MRIPITKFKRVGSDWDLALEKFLNEECPDADHNYRGAPPAGFSTRGTERRALGYELEFPATDKHYTFSNYNLPANKMVHFVGPNVLGGAYIRAPQGVNRAFTLGTGWGSKTFTGLFFDRAGVGLEGDVRGGITFSNCFFDSTPSWAIEFLGMSVVDGLIEKCKFNRCLGGIGILYQACDLWRIQSCRFVRMGNSGVYIKSSGVAVDDCNFENTDGDVANSNLNPYIVIEPGARDDGLSGSSLFAGGLCSVTNCRFGDEVGTGNGPPRESIRLGPEDPTTGTMTGINVVGNYFRGANSPYPDSDHANNAILVTKDVARSNFMRNDFEVFNSYLLNITASGGSPRHNTWQASVHSSHAAGVFSGTDSTLPPDGFKIIESVSHAVVTFGASDLAAATTAQRFMYPAGPIGAVSTTEFFLPCPISGDLNKMYVTAPQGITGSGAATITFRARVNQTDTDHIVSISNTASPFEGTTSGVEKHQSVVAGDKISIRVTKSASPASCPTNVMVSLSINPVVS